MQTMICSQGAGGWSKVIQIAKNRHESIHQCPSSVTLECDVAEKRAQTCMRSLVHGFHLRIGAVA